MSGNDRGSEREEMRIGGVQGDAWDLGLGRRF